MEVKSPKEMLFAGETNYKVTQHRRKKEKENGFSTVGSEEKQALVCLGDVLRRLRGTWFPDGQITATRWLWLDRWWDGQREEHFRWGFYWVTALKPASVKINITKMTSRNSPNLYDKFLQRGQVQLDKTLVEFVIELGASLSFPCCWCCSGRQGFLGGGGPLTGWQLLFLWYFLHQTSPLRSNKSCLGFFGSNQTDLRVCDKEVAPFIQVISFAFNPSSAAISSSCLSHFLLLFIVF